MSPQRTPQNVRVYKSVTGSNDKELRRRVDISQRWVTLLRNSSLRRTAAELAYKTMYLPSVSYVIETTTLTERECHEITAPAVASFLSALGYNTRLGKLVYIAIRTIQQEAGTAAPILLHPEVPLHYVQHGWIMQIREFLRRTNSRIHLNPGDHPTLYRQHDKYIMDELRPLVHSTKTLRQLNYCRVWLQVIRLSDITNANGTHLETRWLNPTTQPLESKHIWPQQGKPIAKFWAQWRRWLVTAFCHTQSLRLRRPLAEWTTPWPHQDRP